MVPSLSSAWLTLAIPAASRSLDEKSMPSTPFIWISTKPEPLVFIGSRQVAQLAGGGAVDEEVVVVVQAQDRGRHHLGDRSLDRIADRLGLARVRHRADQAARRHDVARRHADRLLRHRLHGREPAFAELLP